MILVDTSVWIDHLAATEPTLQRYLDHDEVMMHPYIIGEIALGNLRHRDRVMHHLRRISPAAVARDDEVLELIEQSHLFGLGIGYVDCHLLASVKRVPGTSLWTRDKRLGRAAERLGLAASPPPLH